MCCVSKLAKIADMRASRLFLAISLLLDELKPALPTSVSSSALLSRGLPASTIFTSGSTLPRIFTRVFSPTPGSDLNSSSVVGKCSKMPSSTLLLNTVYTGTWCSSL